MTRPNLRINVVQQDEHVPGGTSPGAMEHSHRRSVHSPLTTRSSVAFSDTVNLVLMLDDSGVSPKQLSQPKARSVRAASARAASVISGPIYGPRPSAALDIKRALFHRYFEPDVPMYNNSTGGWGKPSSSRAGSRPGSVSGALSRLGSIPQHIPVVEWGLGSPGLKTLHEPRSRPPNPDLVAHIPASLTLREHLHTLRRLLATVEARGEGIITGPAAWHSKRAHTSHSATPGSKPTHSPRHHAAPGKHGRDAAVHMANKGFLNSVAATMVPMRGLHLPACQLLAAAGKVAPGVLDTCLPSLLQTLPLVLGGGSGGTQPAAEVRASSAFCATDFYASLRGGATGMVASSASPGKPSPFGSPMRTQAAGTAKRGVRGAATMQAPMSPARALTCQVAANQPPNVRAAALAVVVQVTRSRAGRAAVLSAPRIRELVCIHVTAVDDPDHCQLAASALLHLARANPVELATGAELGAMTTAAAAVMNRISKAVNTHKEPEAGDMNLACTLMAALSHCAMLHVGAQRMATGKGQLPARVASLLSNVATDESALTPCGRSALRLLDALASHQGSEARSAVHGVLADDGDDSPALLALMRVLRAPGHNVVDASRAMNLLWVAVLGEDTLKRKLVANPAHALGAAVIDKLRSVYEAAMASNDGCLQEGVGGEAEDSDSDPGNHPTSSHEASGGGASGSPITVSGQFVLAPEPSSQDPMNAPSPSAQSVAATESAASPGTSAIPLPGLPLGDEEPSGGGAVNVSGASIGGGAGDVPGADSGVPAASGSKAAPPNSGAGDGGGVLSASGVPPHEVVRSSILSSEGGKTPKSVMWREVMTEFEADGSKGMVQALVTVPAVATARPRIARPQHVRDLLSCGLGLLACLCSCVPTEPDVPKALVKSGLLPDFLSTVVHPLLLPDPHSDPGSVAPSLELRRCGLALITNLCTNASLAAMVAEAGLVRVAADCIRQSLPPAQDAGSKSEAPRAPEPPYTTAAGMDISLMVPAARALAAYWRSRPSHPAPGTAAAAGAADGDGPRDGEVAAAEVLGLASQGLVAVLRGPLRRLAAAHRPLPSHLLHVMVEVDMAPSSKHPGCSWAQAELMAVHALGAAAANAAQSTPSSAEPCTTASAAATSLALLLADLLPQVWRQQGAGKASPTSALGACSASVHALLMLVGCGHVAAEAVCPHLMPEMAHGLAAPGQVALQPELVGLLHTLCQSPGCACRVVRDSELMNGVLALYQKAKAAGGNAEGTSANQLRELFYRLKPHDRYGALKKVTLPRKTPGHGKAVSATSTPAPVEGQPDGLVHSEHEEGAEEMAGGVGKGSGNSSDTGKERSSGPGLPIEKPQDMLGKSETPSFSGPTGTSHADSKPGDGFSMWAGEHQLKQPMPTRSDTPVFGQQGSSFTGHRAVTGPTQDAGQPMDWPESVRLNTHLLSRGGHEQKQDMIARLGTGPARYQNSNSGSANDDDAEDEIVDEEIVEEVEEHWL